MITSAWHPEWMDSPEFKAEMARLKRRSDLALRLTSWMRHIPVVGSLVFTFWFSIIEEGVVQTCKPRWGALTFAFLNDGMGATVWHTWRQITHGQDDPYTGIYVDGAPASLKEAEEREIEYLRKRGQAMNNMNVLLPLVEETK